MSLHLEDSVTEVLALLEGGQDAVNDPPPPPSPPPLDLQPPPPRQNVGEGAPRQLGLARRGNRAPLVTYATTEDERTALNSALESEGLGFRADDDEDLQAAKRAAGIGRTKAPCADFTSFQNRLFEALRLGALGGADADPGVQQEYANAFRAQVVVQVPSRKARLQQTDFTFETCERIAEAVTEESIFGLTPSALARKVKDHIGDGSLAGVFPGESKEATPEEGGQDRLDKMNEFGRHIVEILRGAGPVRPELTGSIVLKGGGYGGIPEDLDINVTTKGDEQTRKEQWDAVIETMNDFDGLRVSTDSGPLYIFAMAPGKIQGENDRIWERRYGFPVKFPGETKNRVIPFEVEVKDVGGDVWKEHLKPDAPTRTTDEEGASDPQWLMLDTMTRILGHRNNMIESVEQPNEDMLEDVPEDEKEARWLEMVQQEGLEKSQGKRLWEKLNVAYTMSLEKGDLNKDDLAGWLKKTVKDFAAYSELLNLAEDEDGYEEWLQDIA